MTEITLLETEHIEYLKPDFGLVVSPLHTFGTDAVLLSHFAAPKRQDTACDLGTGCGIIPMLGAGAVWRFKRRVRTSFCALLRRTA